MICTFKEMLVPQHFCKAQYQTQLVLLRLFFMLEMQRAFMITSEHKIINYNCNDKKYVDYW